MRMADFHCDVLGKMLLNPTLRFAGERGEQLDVTYERLQAAGCLLQTFAVYIPQGAGEGIRPVLRAVDHYYEKIVSQPGIMPVTTAKQLEQVLQSGQIGALLSLEGVDGLEGDMASLRLLHRLGVRMIGLTWNHANWAADGIKEKRGGGLTVAGQAFVEECNRLGILLDASHISEKGFWELMEQVQRPLLVSHANTRRHCPHPRNLTDEQISALIAADGRMGLTYVPWFIREDGEARIVDLLRHIEHVCTLGGADIVLLGSDFDGIDTHMQDLRHPGELYRLHEALDQTFGTELTEQLMYKNGLRYLMNNLPTN